MGVWFAVVAMFGFLGAVRVIPAALTGGDDNLRFFVFVLAEVLAFAVRLAVGALLACFSDRLARWLFPGDMGHESVVSVNAEELRAIAFAVVGLWIAISGAMAAMRTGVSLFMVTQDAELRQRLIARSWPACAEHGLRILVGCALFLGARGLSGLLAKLRRAGAAAVERDAEDDAERKNAGGPEGRAE